MGNDTPEKWVTTTPEKWVTTENPETLINRGLRALFQVMICYVYVYICYV